MLFLFSLCNYAQIYTPSGTIQGTSGNNYVGIGTSSPGGPLEIAAGTASTPLRIKGTSTGATWSGRVVAGGPSNVFVMGQYNNHAWLGAHNSALNAWADLYINPEGSSGKKVFIGAHGGRENTIFTVDNATGNSYFMNGNVGIGVEPNYKLDVGGDINLSGGLYQNGQLINLGGAKWELSGSGDAYFNNGNVGIGTNDPQSLLHLYSSSAPAITLTNTGTIYGAKNYYLKVDQSDITNGLPTLQIGSDQQRLLDISGKAVLAYTNFWVSGTTYDLSFNVTPSYRIFNIYNNALHKNIFSIYENDGIGQVEVNGKITAEEIEVIRDVPDFDHVFNTEYNLASINEVEQFIKSNKHLPDIPSAKEFKENGYKVGEMDGLLLKKIEELTLYIIEQQKTIEGLQTQMDQIVNNK